MRSILILLLLGPFSANASFLLQYSLNYSSETEDSDTPYEKARTFHNIFPAASIDGAKKLYFGWNINSWSSSISMDDGDEDEYSLLEMGPRLLWFLNENFNVYISGEWNPYLKGERTKAGEKGDISGSSMKFSLGYRHRISRLWGVGASLNYHTASLKTETIDSTESTLSDTITNIMPMLEISIITK